MISILRKRVEKLVYGEEGAALIVTLALFMMMYISCAGIFAVGQTVKEKMILQNAADAAAYSAAVVEADTLSRIATINRAMAWTYKSMVCRQMDYVTYVWLSKTLSEYKGDFDNPIRKTIGANDADQSADWSSATVGLKRENDPENYLAQIQEIESTLKSLGDDYKDELTGQIDSDRLALEEMNNAISDLITRLSSEMQNQIAKVLAANLPGDLGDRCLMKVSATSYDKWSRLLKGNEESRFLSFEPGLDNGDFRTGTRGDWFPIDDSTSDGLSRSYEGDLVSSWVWYDIDDKRHPLLGYNRVDAGDLNDDYFLGSPRAMPRVLNKSYFNDDKDVARGAISVALAKKNENPWARLVDLSRKGLYDMFTPSGAAKWTLAIASAQAGYRPFGASGSGRDYQLKYEEAENLRTDDWDAVFVPVRRAFASTEFKDFITKDGWNRVAASSVDPSSYNAGPSGAFPNMHNSNGALKKLKWEQLLDGIYH